MRQPFLTIKHKNIGGKRCEVEDRKILTVAQLNGYIKSLLESDRNLRGLWVEGEISNFKAHSSGHLYFGLKDAKASIKVVMFRSRAEKLKFRPENGQKVLVKGALSVFERDGQYQLYADQLEVAGIGDLYLAYEQLKAKLANEGLFALDHKKNLPFLPKKIGVVTSPTGAVWHDIQNVAIARFPGIHLLLYPALVQGEGAAPSIVDGIAYFNRRDDIDLLIVGRGGGSLDDLWAFNEESVARAIYHSRLPVISAVGHETDFTIADLVSDKRAATPSQAAEFSVPALSDLETRLAFFHSALRQKLYLYLESCRGRLRKAKEHYVFQQPGNLFRERLQTLDFLEQRLHAVFFENYQMRLAKYEMCKEKLAVLSPLQTLDRGYGICLRDGRIVKDAQEAKIGDTVEMRLAKGCLHCEVNRIEEDWLKNE